MEEAKSDGQWVNRAMVVVVVFVVVVVVVAGAGREYGMLTRHKNSRTQNLLDLDVVAIMTHDIRKADSLPIDFHRTSKVYLRNEDCDRWGVF